MTDNYREYRTGQGVPATGDYICQSGERATLNEKENFPACPVSGKDTHWKRDDH